MIDNKNNKVAVLGNRLISATYTLPLGAKKLLLLAVSKLDSKKYNQSYVVEITADEWREVYGEAPQVYRDLKKAAQNLKRAEGIVLHNQVLGGVEYEAIELDWVSTVGYSNGEGKVALEIHPRIRQHLVYAVHELGFTKIYLLNVAKLRSDRSIRLYEQLCRFNRNEFYVTSVEKLMDILGAKTPSQRVYGAFKRDIVDRCVKDINENSNYTVKYDAIKRGRTVVNLRFTFVRDSQLDLLSNVIA